MATRDCTLFTRLLVRCPCSVGSDCYTFGMQNDFGDNFDRFIWHQYTRDTIADDASWYVRLD